MKKKKENENKNEKWNKQRIKQTKITITTYNSPCFTSEEESLSGNYPE